METTLAQEHRWFASFASAAGNLAISRRPEAERSRKGNFVL
jgi:hypothetical protein